jgi:hypothetical protein
LVAAPLLANAVHKLWIKGVHPGYVVSLWRFGILDLQLIGHALLRGLHFRVIGKSLIGGVENCSDGSNETQDSKRCDPGGLLVIPELTKREDGGCDWCIVEPK